MADRWLVLALSLAVGAATGNNGSGKVFYIHWNTTNSIFRIDNTDHVFDLNKGNSQFEYDQVNILCPVYSPDTPDDALERHIVYNVSRDEFETCRITNSNPRVIAVCDKPRKLLFFTITFRPFSPQPGGLEFFPGRDYYFISTSSKDDLHRRIGGWCSSHNMKLVFRVCCRPEETSPPPALPPTPPPPPPPTPRRTTTTVATTTARKPFNLDKPPEVVKSEELSFSGSHRTPLLPLVLPLLLVALSTRLLLVLPSR